MKLIRTEYLQLAANMVMQGQIKWAMDQGVKYLKIRSSRNKKRAKTGPLMGSILVTYKCNNTCLMCDFPQMAARRHKEGDRELNEEQMMDVIDQFHTLGTSGIGFSGGEPLLRKDIYDMVKRCKTHGMVTNLNSNANLLCRDDYAEKLVKSGLDLLNISVDGSNAETHDYLRNTPGGFEKIMEAMDKLNDLRKKYNKRMLINWVSVISPKNVDQVGELLELAKSRGVNKTGFMPVHHFDFQDEEDRKGLYETDSDFEKEAVECVEKILEYKKRYPIDNSERYIKLFKYAFTGQKSPLECYASYHSLMVNTYGEIFPCFPYIEMKKPVGNILETPLKEFWYSDTYNEMRHDIDACKDCLWNCHTELNLMFNK